MPVYHVSYYINPNNTPHADIMQNMTQLVLETSLKAKQLAGDKMCAVWRFESFQTNPRTIAHNLKATLLTRADRDENSADFLKKNPLFNPFDTKFHNFLFVIAVDIDMEASQIALNTIYL